MRLNDVTAQIVDAAAQLITRPDSSRPEEPGPRAAMTPGAARAEAQTTQSWDPDTYFIIGASSPKQLSLTLLEPPQLTGQLLEGETLTLNMAIPINPIRTHRHHQRDARPPTLPDHSAYPCVFACPGGTTEISPAPSARFNLPKSIRRDGTTELP